MALIKTLQTQVAPQIFTPRAVYDGRKNMFAIRELPFGGSSSQEVLSTISSFGGDCPILFSSVRCQLQRKGRNW